MNKYQRKRAILRKKGVKKERFFIRNGASKWEFVEVSEAEADYMSFCVGGYYVYET